jgi:Uri superfamily endonuclease
MHTLKESGKGTYILILLLQNIARIRIGKLGAFEFNPGYYVYVGSAFGPGGLGCRVERHRKVNKTCHWHIDYLRRRCRLTATWYMVSSVCREHDWARVLAEKKGASISVPGFGSSDCGCPAHLVYNKTAPALSDFKKILNILFPDDPMINGISE